ncbi:hypothetical protein NP233_g10980 [Leucocoprinus birnbaumii]|uniref:Uncharacterized protein n=1 Tax=Leucocoprinus birnbaumii TaxID=56174 RepID=A0AAD5VNA3_9AGAR|nr:hypothetical protein NP233_g10980 [Leucocoprinus birnbaumii]
MFSRSRDKKEARAIAECDILITQWRSGKAYGKAFKLNKTIGTMAWLYHVESTGLMPRPVDQLLHYPIPQTLIASFVNHQITVTNDFKDGTTSSMSPTKRSIVAASSSPSKRATTAMKISPTKSKTKSVSPIKRRRIVSDDDEMDADQPTREDEQVKRHRRNVQAMAVSSDKERAPVTPAKKSKSSPAKKKSPAKKQPSVDLELTDESDEELDGGMDALLKSTQAKKKKQDMDNSDDKAVIWSGKKKKVTRVESSAEEEEPESKPKKKLVRRLTNETSLELEAARAEGSATKAKLAHHASKPPMNAEKENTTESPKEGKRPEAPVPKTSGLLEMLVHVSKPSLPVRKPENWIGIVKTRWRG